MGGVVGGSKPKAAPIIMPDPLPPAPERSDAETQALADEQRKRFAGSSAGRAATFLTQGGTSAASSAVRFLGGAAAT